MRKMLLLFLISITLFLTACGLESSSSSQSNAIEEEAVSPLYLEVVFGNGEALRTEIEYIAFPHDNLGKSDYCQGFTYILCSPDNIPYYGVSRHLNNFLHVSYAKLLTGEKYSFAEAYDVSFDAESTTVTVYVWRDRPYAKEYELFEPYTGNILQKHQEKQK